MVREIGVQGSGRKVMMMPKALHQKDDRDRLYVSSKEGKGLASIEDCANATTKEYNEYTKKCKESPIKASRNKKGNIRTK